MQRIQRSRALPIGKRGAEQNARITQGQQTKKPSGAELSFGYSQNQQCQRGYREHEPSLYTCDRPGLMMVPVEHEEHDVKKHEIDTWAGWLHGDRCAHPFLNPSILHSI